MTLPTKDRTVALLTALTFVMLALGALALWWVRHREAVSDARYQRVQDSLTVAEGRLHDTVTVLQSRAAEAAVAVARTDTVYRERIKVLASATIVTEHHDTVYLDTVAPVRAAVLSCRETIAARDTALSVCAQRVAALRSLFSTDSLRQAATIVHLGQDVGRAKAAGRRQGWVQGAIVAVSAVLLVRAVLK
jgi:archaellum component FlaF (FlaF/FlaG flagellin family)